MRHIGQSAGAVLGGATAIVLMASTATGTALAFPFAPQGFGEVTGHLHRTQQATRPGETTDPNVDVSPGIPVPTLEDDDGHLEERRKTRRSSTGTAGAIAPAPVTGTATAAAAILPAAAPVTSSNTALVAARAREITLFCEKLPVLYSVDCVTKELRELANGLPRSGDYAEAQAALDRVASELEQISRANRDRAQPTVALRVQRAGTSRPVRTDSITAVRPERAAAAQQQAAQAVERLQVELLRSVPASDPRQVHYQRIADAFDSTTVLLRS